MQSSRLARHQFLKTFLDFWTAPQMRPRPRMFEGTFAATTPARATPGVSRSPLAMAPRPSPPRHRAPPRALPLPVLLVRLLVASLSLLQLPVHTSADTPITLMVQDNVAAKMDTYTYEFAATPETASYIKWFEPRADMAVVHHMLLFGCEHAVSPGEAYQILLILATS